MNKTFFDEKIADISKSIMSYCVTRTANRYDAEDLAQSIMEALVKSVDNIRDDKAFYGFMWAVAGKVYAGWCRKKAKTATTALPEHMPDTANPFDAIENSDLYLLRRELTLLSERYRKAVVLYYVENMPCAQIAHTLGTSESMVKHLLFKARKILKEGMNMERNYGEQSYNPRQLSILYMGSGPNRFWKLGEGAIAQNILWTCYSDSLSPEEISLQIGVAMPYLEGEIKPLLEAGLLMQKSGRYSTNIIIFTDEFKREMSAKVAGIQDALAQILYGFIVENEERIRAIGFHMSDMSKNSLLWHVSCVALLTLFDRLGVRFEDYPVTAFGDKAFVWGAESADNVLNCCTMTKEFDSLEAGALYCLDYVPAHKTNSNDFYRHPQLANFFMKLAAGKITNPGDYEKEFIAELIKFGYAGIRRDEIYVTAPVYTQAQWQALSTMLPPLVEEMYALAMDIEKSAEGVLKNHVPAHLKKQTGGIIKMRMFDDAIGATVEAMRRKDYLKASWDAGEMPTTTVVLE